MLTGIALSLLELIPHLRKPKLGISVRQGADKTELELSGTATFVQLPRLSKALDDVPERRAAQAQPARASAMWTTPAPR